MNQRYRFDLSCILKTRLGFIEHGRKWSSHGWRSLNLFWNIKSIGRKLKYDRREIWELVRKCG